MESTTVGHELVGWLSATIGIPVFLTVALAFGGVDLRRTVDQGQLALVAAAVGFGAAVVESGLASRRAGELLLRMSHMALFAGGALYYYLPQSDAGGRITTELPWPGIAGTAALVVVGIFTSARSIWRQAVVR